MSTYYKHKGFWSLFIPLVVAVCITQACTRPLPPTPTASPVPPHCQGREDVQTCTALTEQARATWRSFEKMAYPDTGLPADKVCRASDGSFTPHRQTKPTNIAAYLWSTVSARDLGFIDDQEAESRIDRTLATLERMERAHGFYIDWYDASTGEPLATWPDSGDPVRPFLSAVDNGWLATALMIIREATPQFAPRADALLQDMDFGFFHDSKVGLLYGGYWTDTGEYTEYHYDILNTETRISSYLGIADGELPLDSYNLRHRVVSCSVWDWQEQCSEGCYLCQGLEIVPSWGGSMFEALMVELFVPEAEWGPTSWGTNHPRYIQAQIKHGLEETMCGYWGFSPCNNGQDKYGEYGVDCIGIRPDGYCPNDDGTTADYGLFPIRSPQPTPRPEEYTNCVVTPHASFLALEFAPEETLENLANLRRDFEVYGELGFYDGVNVQTGQVSRCHLALDQGMIMAAVANYLLDDLLEGYFAPQIETEVRPLLAEEIFCPQPSSEIEFTLQAER
jgi:hypothetical protein